MSNETMTYATPAEAPVDGQVEVAEEVAATPKKSSIGYRLLAILAIGLCAAILLLDISTFVSVWAIKAQPVIMDTVNGLLDSNANLFGFLPAFFASTDYATMVANLLPYILAVCLVVAVVLSIVALITGKGGVLRVALFFVTWSVLLYFLAVYALSTMYVGEATLDTFLAVFAGVAVLATFLAKLGKLGKKAWLWLLQFVLSVAVIVLFTMSIFFIAVVPGEALEDIYSLVAIVCVALILVNAMVTFFRPSMGIVRAIIQLVLAVAVAVVAILPIVDAFSLVFEVAMMEVIFLFAAVVLALAQLIIAIVARPKKEEEVVEEPVVEDEYAGFRKETVVEAYAYDGGPVAGVELAEEVNPTAASINAVNNPDAAAQSTVASLLGNGFDPFLISLSNQEKEEFIDLYVLKVKGMMPEIPGYVVGGDNKDFFNKVFIYLGQYREKIPATLLNKMYNFSMKI